MYNSLVEYYYDSTSGNMGRGRAFVKFEHTPPTRNDILAVEDRLRKEINTKTVIITNVSSLTMEKEDNYAQ